MRQDRAAHNGQVGVGAHEVVGELPDEVQQLSKAGPIDLHGCVDAVQADAVPVSYTHLDVYKRQGSARTR